MIKFKDFLLEKILIETYESLDESLKDVLKYASDKHLGQTRSSGEKYIRHPIRVAKSIMKYKKSHNIDSLIKAALLHDTIEDTDTTHEDLEKLYGGLVASLVKQLTSDKEEIKKIGKTEYLSKKMKQMSNYALAIKLVDRLDNVSDIATTKTPQWRKNYKRETEKILNTLEKERNLTNTHKNIIKDIKNKLKEIK